MIKNEKKYYVDFNSCIIIEIPDNELTNEKEIKTIIREKAFDIFMSMHLNNNWTEIDYIEEIEDETNLI